MQYNQLSKEEERIIEQKGTERPFSGEYDDFYLAGTFICRKCNSPLFSSKAKFDAGCGWPAFDENFPDAIKRIHGQYDGNEYDKRTEVQCANCQAHLGHVFEGEKFTKTNTRHCVNSLSIKFIKEGEKLPEVLK